MHEYEIFFFLWFLFLGSSQLINFILILQFSKRVFIDFSSLSIDFGEWEEEDMAKDFCIQVFYFEKT